MEKKSILASTIQVSAALFLIKLLGVLKQSLVAAICGATAETDAYFIATGVITALCTVVFSAVSISLLSIHTDRLIKQGRESSNRLISTALLVFLPIAVVITAIFAIGSPIVAKLLAPAYTGEQLQLLIRYIRIMSPMFICCCYFLIINVVLETDKRFLPGKGQAFFQNLFVIIAAVFLYKKIGIQALVFAFLAAGIVNCVAIMWSARKLFKFSFSTKGESGTIRYLLAISIPLVVGNAIYEINDIVDKQIASGLGHGNVSFLSYGASINEIVTTLIIQSVSTVIFSHYATWITEGKIKECGDNLKRSLEYLFVIIMPVMVMCIVDGNQIVKILYGRGNFGNSEIMSTYGVVIGYAIGFVFQAARANIVKIYYAFQDTKRPMINGAISIGVNIMLSILLSRFFGVAGIAVATSIAMLIVTILLLPGVRKYIPEFNIKTIFPECGKGIVGGAIIAAGAVGLKMLIPGDGLIKFIIIGAFVVVVYLGLMLLMKSNCILYFAGIAKAKMKRIHRR